VAKVLVKGFHACDVMPEDTLAKCCSVVKMNPCQLAEGYAGFGIPTTLEAGKSVF
jgi:hypothetical protein